MFRVKPTIAALLVACFLPVPTFADQDEYTSASLDGASGLFTLWDAEPLRSKEMNFAFAVNQYTRDPGQLRITRFPVSGGLGAFGFLEFFGAFDVQKRIEAGSIQVGRTGPGDLPSPARTQLGQILFTTEALFMDVREATGRGDVRGGVKISLLSERRRHPIGLSAVAFGEVPTQDNWQALRRGLSSKTKSGGFGALVSKRLGDAGQFHANFLINFVRSPRGEFAAVDSADVGHEYIFRAGVIAPNKGKVRLIGELDGKLYAADYSDGLNPVNPVDLLLGIRLFANRSVALSGGYRLALNHIKEDSSQLIFARGRNGFVVQLAFGLRRN
jgi:hypothetical protein